MWYPHHNFRIELYPIHHQKQFIVLQGLPHQKQFIVMQGLPHQKQFIVMQGLYITSAMHECTITIYDDTLHINS
jgi:hypothetical protein